jgi:hypothetical protein
LSPADLKFRSIEQSFEIIEDIVLESESITEPLTCSIQNRCGTLAKPPCQIGLLFKSNQNPPIDKR